MEVGKFAGQTLHGFLLQTWGCLGYVLRQMAFMLSSANYVKLV
jgi:hypothetical protein